MRHDATVSLSRLRFQRDNECGNNVRNSSRHSRIRDAQEARMRSEDLSTAAAVTAVPRRLLRSRGYDIVHAIYSLLTHRVTNPLSRQRIRLIGLVWGYWPLLTMRRLSFRRRLELLARFLRIDWSVVHGHSPSEIAQIALAIDHQSDGRPRHFVEAGCWQGGSSAKFSILCRLFGYRLHVYDSFEGVGDLSPTDRAKEWDYEGQYSAPEATLLGNLDRYGERSVVSTHRGWFSETLARGDVPAEISIAYIDCDVAKGTRDALAGVVPALAPDGIVFSQDFHIGPARALLTNAATWSEFGVSQVEVKQLGRRLAMVRCDGGVSRSPETSSHR
jgi:O-methyltransferase